VPRVVAGGLAYHAQGLGFAAGAVLARVDGVATAAQIVARARLPEVDATRALAELYLRGMVALD
jgi:hypothetical protein